MSLDQFQLRNAKLYNNRWDWVSQLPHKMNIMEVGVSAGDFAEHMYNTIKPQVLYLVDTWEQSDSIFQRGQDNLRFKEGENLAFVQNRFPYNNVEILKGTSQEVLPHVIKDNNRQFKFDLIYLDAGHSYEEVMQDINNSVQLLSDRGVLVINDYVYIGDPKYPPYGVIKAVNEFLNKHENWEVSGLILEDHMMCDIILRQVR
jgi:hypothetical protein